MDFPTNHDGTQPDAPTLLFSRFENKRDNAPKSAALTWPEIGALLSKRRLTRSDTDAAKDGAAFSGAAYLDGATRSNANAAAVSLAILDFDGGATLEEIEAGVSRLNNGAGAAAFIYSTFSHTPETPKFRVVLPLSAPVVASDWPDVWARLALAFDGAPDEKAKDAARLHFLPSCPKERAGDAIAREIGGDCLDVATLPTLPEPARPSAPEGERDFGSIGGSGDAYARNSFKNEIERLRATTSGRNQALNNTARRLGQFIGAARLERAEVEAELWSACAANGYTAKDGEKQTRDTIKSGLDAGEREPNRNGLPKEKRGAASAPEQQPQRGDTGAAVV